MIAMKREVAARQMNKLVQVFRGANVKLGNWRQVTFFMASQVMRITLKAYDHQLVDASAKKIIETVKKNGSQVSGPVPLPTKKEVVTILRAVHKYKDSREQFEQRTHKRLIDIITPTQKTVDALSRLEMPAGVFIDIKMKSK